jgi:hypothetical protein
VKPLVLAAALTAFWSGGAAQKPNFTGTWQLDHKHSEHRAAADTLVVTQTERELRIHQVLCCRQAGEEWISTYHFNHWGPRHSTPIHREKKEPRHDTKPTQVRWDGDALVMHAGPELDRVGGSVRIWRLAAAGTELHESIVNRGLGLAFDFKEASIPTFYARDRHVYTLER